MLLQHTKKYNADRQKHNTDRQQSTWTYRGLGIGLTLGAALLHGLVFDCAFGGGDGGKQRWGYTVSEVGAAALLNCFVIGVAWLWYRPVLSVSAIFRGKFSCVALSRG
jgi:hypothetical protein